MQHEDLQKKVERLEYYMTLMRDMVADIESYALWDYIMGEQLNEEQANELLAVLRKHYTVLQSEKAIAVESMKSELYSDLIHVLTSFGKPASENTARSILLRASKLPIFPLYSSLLKN